MNDPILKAADEVTESGDALFAGESNDCYLVHTSKMDPGDIFKSQDGSVQLRIIGLATAEEYEKRCPHIPKLVKPERYFIYLTRRLVN